MSTNNHITITCNKCGESKPTTEFYRDSSMKSGFQSICKVCARARSLSAYYQMSDEDKAQRVIRRRDWVQKNKDRVLGYHRKHYAVNQAGRVNSSVRWNQSNPDKTRRYSMEYKTTHAGKVNEVNARRRATKLSATPWWVNKDDLAAVYTEAKRRREAGEDVHVDHIVPLNNPLVCGLHVPWNLQIIPATINLRKSNRLDTLTDYR